MGIVIVLGSLITDLVARAPRLPHPGESFIGDEFGTFLGGKGFNQAVAAARLGASVTLIGRVGTDVFGDAFFPACASEGIHSEHLTRDSSAGTGIACIMIATDSGQNAIIVLPRSNLTITPAEVEATMQTILSQPPTNSALSASPGVFMAQCEMRMATIATGLRLAHEAGMTTMLNAAPIPRGPFPDDLFPLIDILAVNETEAAALAGLAVDSPMAAHTAAEGLLAQGSKHVVITLGAQGAIWSTLDSKGTHVSHQEIPAISVKQVDATAAGDAFCGALAASLAEGMPMMKALTRATAAGAVTVTRRGAFPSLPTAAEIEELLGQ